jgi:hypothetical protein
VPLYAAAALGAFLLFLVQPIAARFILPWFGGGPAVWSTCLLFFQGALLAGYGYAHWTRQLGLVKQTRLHLVLLALAALTLPIAPSAAWSPVDPGAPALRILRLLTASVGAPYLMLAATAPLLQDWLARSGSSVTPYRLYALSNAGSLLALVAYPIAVEPFLTLHTQSTVWSILFVIFGGVCAWAAAAILKAERRVVPDPDDPIGSAAAVPGFDRTMWLLWSAGGSGLLLAATNELCQDIAVVPLLWIVPLAIYLLTFILCFADLYRRSWWAPLLLAGIGAAAWLTRHPYAPFPVQFAVLVFVLIAGCMVCHGELVRIRPAASRLTSFYLAVAAGGGLGGLSVALLAPAVFDRFWEFAIFVVLPLPLLMAALYRDPHSRLRRGAVPILWGGMIAAAVAAVWAFATIPAAGDDREIARARNFYGVLSVSEDFAGSPLPMRRLRHGRILHGAQFLEPRRRRLAPTYYGDGTGIEVAIRTHPRRLAGQPLRIGVVGLGSGTIAALGERGDTIRFFEINPVAIDFAHRYFTFLADSRATVDVITGDARLSIEREVNEGLSGPGYDVLALDAFSGDAIPVHLLTREAFASYAKAMTDGGVLAVHVTNRYLDLRPVVRGLAAESGLQVVETHATADVLSGVESSTWMLVTRNGPFLAGAHAFDDPGSAHMPPLVWTDSFSSLWPVLER